MQKKCEKCGTMFEAIRSNANFCSKPCYYAVWAEKNEHVRAAARARYYEKNKDEVIARGAEWVKENRERSREIKREHYARNKEEIKNRSAVFAKEYPGLVRAYKAKHEKTDAGRLTRKATTHRRRARIKANGGTFSRAEFVALVERCGNQCVACKTPAPAVKLEPDHIIPIALGGINDITNIQPLCRSCNAKKRAKTVNYLATTGGLPEPENGT